MKISDELSEIAAEALAEKKREQALKIAMQLAKQQAEIERQKRNKKEARRIQRNNAKVVQFLATVKHELFLAAWGGSKKIDKKGLSDWQVEALKKTKYRVESNEKEHSALNKTIHVDLPKSIEALIKITKEANRFDLIRTATVQLLGQNWKELDVLGLRDWLSTLNNAFCIASRAYAGEVAFRNNNEALYLTELNRLDPRLEYIKKNIHSIDAGYSAKLAQFGLSTIDSKDPDRPEKIERKKIIIRRVLEEHSSKSWQEISNTEIKLIFHAVRSDFSLTSAASDLRQSSKKSSQFDDDVLNLFADFTERTADNRAFERSHDSFRQQLALVEKLVDLVASLASKLGITGDPLAQLNLTKGHVIYPSQKSADFPTYDFLLGCECKKFKFELEQQMRGAALRGAKSISLQCKEYQDGIDLKGAAVKTVFLPFSMKTFLELVSDDGLGYEVFDNDNLKFTLNLMWN